MPHPLCEFGYTIDAKHRKDEHQRHRSSNWLMNLTEAICMRRFGRNRYRMKFYVIYCVPLPTLSALAEAFITVIGQRYTANGGGFSFQPAGESTHSETRFLTSKCCSTWSDRKLIAITSAIEKISIA